jgi:hypothetical protein
MPDDLLVRDVRRPPLAHVAAAPEPAPVMSDTASLLAVISRAASDPNVDIDKFERLLALSERVQAQQAAEAYHTAMTAAQGEMRPICADANNPQTRSKYASFYALDLALRPIYTRHGFALSYDTGDGAPPEHVRVVCRVSRGGHTELFHIDMPADGKGAKGGDVMTKTHATGAATTYGQRYLLRMIFNIAIFDDDGNSASPPPRGVTTEQIAEINNLAERAGVDKIDFCGWLGAESFATLTTAQYRRAKQALEARIAKRSAQ